MFQNFDDIADPTRGKPRVAKLRKLLTQQGLTCFLVPRADEFQNEYVPANAERLAWLTGFTGSAGMAVVMQKQAALFVDGRYTLQAPEQVDTKLFSILQTPENTPSGWLKKNLRKGNKVGYDPRLHTMRAVERLEKALKAKGAVATPVEENLVDRIWDKRPRQPRAAVVLHPLDHAGVTAAKKIETIRKALRKKRANATVLTLPESVCWLLNIRGNDVPHTPITLARAIVPLKGKPQLFIDPGKLDAKVANALKKDVQIKSPGELADALAAVGESGGKVLLDPDQAPRWFADRLTEAGAEIVHGVDPCQLPKAIKNKSEINGMRAAHVRDGEAVCRFLAWLDANASSGKLDEIKCAKKLESLRRETNRLKDISFDTISGAGANGAIVHYRVSKSSNAPIEPNTLYLVDSGAQYVDGTTDITRTVAIGQPSLDMIRHCTLVLKGHIAVSIARFPKGSRGADLDPLAREALWKAGLDFDHGTGHGVGSYLSVHEGPQRISKLGTTPLEPGMILSNEPGYYRTGQYGIRIENLVLVTPARKVKGGERPMMGFETLTLAPYDTRLIDISLLTPEETRWVNAYHKRVFKVISPGLKQNAKTWLEQACRPLEAI